MNLITLPTIDSTNSYCLRNNYLLEQNNLVVRALKQTNGRGRFDRTWISSEVEEDLSFSIIHHPISNYAFEITSIYVGLSVYRILLKIIGSDVNIKHPNDILWKNFKISGILLEKTKVNNKNVIIIGIGINVNSSKKQNLENSISLFEILKRKVNLENILTSIVEEFQKINKTNELTIEQINEWNKACVSIGKEVILKNFKEQFNEQFKEKFKEQSKELFNEKSKEQINELFKEKSKEQIKEQFNNSIKAKILGIDKTGGLRLFTEKNETIIYTGEVIYI